MLTADNLSLFKDDKKIFSNLGFSLSKNSALVIRGDNGSGKTSLLKILAGISGSSAGSVLWGGVDIKEMMEDYLGDSQFLGHKNFLKKSLSIRENLEFYAKLNETNLALNSALSFFELNDLQDKKIKDLSAGWQKRVMLAKLLACPASVWFLDEPSNNLDKKGKEKLHGLINSRVKDGGVVVLTTHDEMFFDLGPKLDLQDFN